MHSTTSIFAIFLIAFCGILAQTDDKDCNMADFVTCRDRLKTIVLKTNPYVDAAGDKARLFETCSQVIGTVACMDGFYFRCRQDKIREEIEGYGSLRNFTGNVCTEGSQLNGEFLKNSGCMKNAEQSVSDCVGDKNMDRDQNAICCVFDKLSACMVQTYRDKCGTDAARLGEIITTDTMKPVLPPKCNCSISTSSSSLLSQSFVVVLMTLVVERLAVK